MISMTSVSASSTPTMAFSDAARYSDEEVVGAQRRLWESFSLGSGIQEAIEELDEEFAECARPNWDGHGARPISADTYYQARQFLEALPQGTPAPTISAEPDGHLSLEWYRNVRRLLSVSVSPEGELHYAAVIGPNKAYGTEVFFGHAPDWITDLIDRVTSA